MEVHLHLIFERGVKALAYTPMSERGTVGVVANAIFSEIESLLSMKEKIAFEQNKGFCFVTPTVSLNEEGLYRAEGEDTP